MEATAGREQTRRPSLSLQAVAQRRRGGDRPQHEARQAQRAKNGERWAERSGADDGGIDYLPFSDVEQSVRDDVSFLQDSPLVPADVLILGTATGARTVT